MDEIDQIDITFNDEEMKAVYENLKHWLRAMVEEDYSLEALSEVMSTYSLIHAYTYADHESVRYIKKEALKKRKEIEDECANIGDFF